jgi:hypothetical protein
MGDVYFYLSDFESSSTSDEDMEHTQRGDAEEESNFMASDLPLFIDETSNLSFHHISVEPSTKFNQFTLASRNLMIECLQRQTFPTFHEIREADGNFRPLLKNHGRVAHVDDPIRTQERWVKLQNSLKLIETIHGVGLSTSSDPKDREIPHIGIWSSLVSTLHVGPNGNHLPLHATVSAIRTKWIMDERVGGISASFIESCIKSCSTCHKNEFWDEVHNIPCELVNDKLDEICKTHIVVRRFSQSHFTKRHKISYYQCHRGGKKRSRKRKKEGDVSTPICRRERKSMKCECQFQIKVRVPLVDKKGSIEFENSMEANIYVHSKHNGHHPGTEGDKMFLPVHPLIISFAMENLKHMISTSTVSLVSIREEKKMQAMVPENERTTYRFFLIPKEVEQLSYFNRLNGNCLLSILSNSLFYQVHDLECHYKCGFFL